MLKDKRTYRIEIIKKNKIVSTSSTKSLRRFLANCRLVQFKDSIKKVHIHVNYGLKEDVYGKMSYFTNEGIYDNKKDLLFAAKAFTQEI
jgi:3-phenylpropionate/cinnamic acid dioxygenase small subunit